MKSRNIPKKPAAKRSSPKNLGVITPDFRESVRQAAYLGKKGYTIPKEVLGAEELKFLQTELFLKPFVPGGGYGVPSGEEAAFPVYRENEKKVYLPRFYGIERYGLPAVSEIDPGLDIQVPFVKPLRDYQEKIVNIYLDGVTKTPDGCGGGILQVWTGAGKTVMALKIAASLGKKTMILVHKEFLMNQWIERIEEYMPSARVGKIQAQVLDIENKDIVIAMIQTMYNRTFPAEVHSQFGLTIIDEVHRIGSEEFSKTLLRCITPYMLGISATVERKDKLTKLLYMFIGKMLYSSERKQDDPVCVRGIEFISNDTAFNETETDFRGKPKYSTMIGKLCEFGPRKDFVVRVLQDLIEEHPEKQIMVLVHNRSLLTYLHDAIVHRGFATTGFYVGGMKPAALKETESRQIVLATYAMAAEALDIKTLSTLVMATPKTDITQSVGRILRMKHENPIIVDIVDSHDLFQNQWKQRKRYYKKCNYRIRCIDSKKYSGMSLDWSADKTWLWAFEPKEVSDTEEAATEEKEPVTIFGGKCCINLEDL